MWSVTPQSILKVRDYIKVSRYQDCHGRDAVGEKTAVWNGLYRAGRWLEACRRRTMYGMKQLYGMTESFGCEFRSAFFLVEGVFNVTICSTFWKGVVPPTKLVKFQPLQLAIDFCHWISISCNRLLDLFTMRHNLCTTLQHAHVGQYSIVC